MCLVRSLKHIGCQIIDDLTGKTLVSASTRDRDLRTQVPYGGNKDAAAIVGKAIAEKALAAKIKEVRFDRGHCSYHGRVAALADADYLVGFVAGLAQTELFQQAPKLKLIQLLSAGYDDADIDAVRASGVPMASTGTR